MSDNVGGNDRKNSSMVERIELLEKEVATLKHNLTQLEEQLSIQNTSQQTPILDNPQIFESKMPEMTVDKVQSAQVTMTKVEKAQSIPQPIIQQPRSEQAEPSNTVISYLIQGNPLLKVGVIVLFLGIAFLLRYVGEQISLEARYLMVLVTAFVTSILGVRLQKKRREYGLTLQGLGLGVMYLTILAAVKLHQLFSPTTAFVAMVVLVCIMVIRAVIQEVKIMAQIAVIAGLATPILLSNGAGSHLVLFSYLALLNLGVAIIAFFKIWRSLNLISFIGTSIIAVLWGTIRYQTEWLVSTEFFLIYHWLLYTVIVVLFAHNTMKNKQSTERINVIPNSASLAIIWQNIRASGYRIGALDSSLLFGSALLTFGLQYQIVQFIENAAALSALLWAAVYGLCALYFFHLDKRFIVIKQAFLALVLVFITLAIPLKFEQQWTMATWTLEALLIYSFGLRQQQPQTRLDAIVLYLLAILMRVDSIIIPYDSIFEFSLIAISGIAMYATQQYFHRNPAYWERNGIATILTIALWYMLQLPLVQFNIMTVVILSVYALVFAGIQWRTRRRIFSVFALLSMLSALMFSTEQVGTDILIILGFFATAFALQKAKWLSESEQNRSNFRYFNIVAGWIILFLAFAKGLYLFEYYFYKNNISNVRLFAWLIWQSVILLLAFKLRWSSALRMSTILSLAFIFCFFHLSQYYDGEDIKYYISFSENLFLALGSLLAFLSLKLLSADSQVLHPNQFNKLAHILILPAYLITWNISIIISLTLYNWEELSLLASLVLPFALWVLCSRNTTLFTIYVYGWIYTRIHTTLLALYCIIWFINANLTTPPQFAVPYLPVLNMVEFASLAVLYQLYYWLKSSPISISIHNETNVLAVSLPILFLLLISCGTMRLWHFYADIPWQAEDLLSSLAIQASLSIIWALTAIMLMVSGHRASNRTRWFFGVAVMTVVIFKLFFVELSNSDSIERIVSFIVVGLLLLLVGWFAPIPPKQKAE